MAKIGAKELDGILTGNGWTLQAALDVVFVRTGAAVNARSVRKGIERYGQLSTPLSALFRLLALHVQALRELALAQGQVSALIGEINQLRARGAW